MPQTPPGELTALPKLPGWIWGERKERSNGRKKGKGKKGKG